MVTSKSILNTHPVTILSHTKNTKMSTCITARCRRNEWKCIAPNFTRKESTYT